ncbi:MAG: prepilin-type N-terminal cleavage/methylation domain-containing protein [Gemmatimonadaceae bacterium]
MQNRKRKGFTLIELLIVVVIIGILAAIAIPKFANTKEKAYMATMKGDLRNLATAQEGYAADNAGAYFSGAATVTTPHASGYAPSTGVSVTAVADSANNGWHATATHGSAAGKLCFIWTGTVKTGASAPGYASDAGGEPKCN